MQNKLYPLKYNKEHYAAIANDVIKGKQDMTLQEARLIRLIITQIVREDKDFKAYTINIEELASFFEIDSSNLYRSAKQLCKQLMSRVIHIGTSDPRDPWKMFHWVDEAQYDGSGNITVKLSEQIKPYVLELDRWFTQYKYKEILCMNSYYAIRLYELIKCQDGINKHMSGTVEYTVEELRYYLSCEDKLKQWQEFKKNVIEISAKEINSKTDIFITTEYIKTGRTITSVRFYIRANYANIKERQNERLANS